MNKTIIVSSHLLSEIEQIATRVLIIEKGMKLVEGNASELLDPSQTIVELQTMDNVFASNIAGHGTNDLVLIILAANGNGVVGTYYSSYPYTIQNNLMILPSR